MFIMFWISTILFTIEYLKLEVHSKRMYTTLKIMVAICVGMIPYTSLIRFVQVFIIITSFLKLLAGYLTLVKGYNPAKYFVISWSFFLISNIITSLRDMGVIDWNFYINQASRLGSVIESVLLSLGLGASYRQLEEEKKDLKIKADQLIFATETMQMIVHDLRKPFSIVSIITEIFTTSTPEKISKLSSSMLPKVKAILTHVSEIFNDITAIGSDFKLTISPRSINEKIFS